MQKQILDLQEEQQRQAAALLLANRHGAITNEDILSDVSGRPSNLEIMKTTFPKLVFNMAVENTIIPLFDEHEIPKRMFNGVVHEKVSHVLFISNLCSRRIVCHSQDSG